MSALRKTIFWLHLGAGAVAGVVILVMSVTGVALAFEKQIIAWADRDLNVTVPGDAARMPVESLLATVRAATPGNAPTAVTLRSAPESPLVVSFGREKSVLINPYTGAVLGEGSKNVRAFMRLMIEWHRWLGMHGEQRAIGKAVTGACNFAFLVLVVTGLYLWFPRRWSVGAVRSVALFGAGLRGKARDWNWHHVIGIWTAVPLFFIAATALFFSYSWATPLLYRALGEQPPPAAPRAGAAASGDGRRAANSGTREPRPGALDALLAQVQQHNPGWKIITMRLGPSISLVVDHGTGGQPNRKTQFTADAATGEIVATETYASYSAARKVRLWSRWIHTGEALGLFGQAIALLASAGGAVLVWTGLSLAIRRLITARRHTRTPRVRDLEPEVQQP